MQKSGKGKSARKPLADISNAKKKPSKDPSAKKILEKQRVEETPGKDPKVSNGSEDSALDRLLLAHSDLSNLTRQIDELIVQALRLNETSKMERQEIESFMYVLSEMCSTLKPWLPRFQQALSRPSAESQCQLEQSLPTQPESATKEERNDVPKYPEKLELGTLISPSPLVSWRANCRLESGRQLFLLTPLPKWKEFSSKCPRPSKSVSEVPHMSTPCTLSLPPLLTISGDLHDGLSDDVEFKPTSRNISKSTISIAERTDHSFISPLKSTNQQFEDCSMLFMTPLLKMSPPKTCRFLEPVSESFQQNKNEIIKPTPSASGVQDSDESLSYEKSSSHASGCLASNYPELFGIQLTRKSAIKRKDVEVSLDWFLSPPKTCILMEPDEKLQTNAAGCNLSTNKDVLGEQAVHVLSARDKKICDRCQLTMKPCNHGLCSTSLAASESTPMWKGLESTIRKGKPPGENTLKRELWTKFDAVSTSNVLHFNVSLFQETERKGFLDRLEEVSCEETGLESKDSL